MSSWTKFRDKIAKPAIATVGGFAAGGIAGAVAANGALSTYNEYQDNADQAKGLAKTAAEQREQAIAQQAQAMETQNERFAAESKILNSQQERYDNIYAPMEQSLADDINQGPQVEQAAGIAGGNFANAFDSSVAARERAQMQRGSSSRAGSSASRMEGENDAFNRASGIATAQTTARREEDDAHFLKQNAFYQSGSGIQSQVLQGMQTMYGSEYNAQLNQAGFTNDSANQNQQFSSALNEQNNATVGAIADIGTQLATSALGAYTGGASTAAQAALTTDVSDGFVYPKATTGSASSGAIPTNLYNDATYQTPKANQYMNDGSTNQNQAAIAGSNRALINQYGT